MTYFTLFPCDYNLPHFFSSSWVQSIGVFESILWKNNRLVFWKEHKRRAEASFAFLFLRSFPYEWYSLENLLRIHLQNFKEAKLKIVFLKDNILVEITDLALLKAPTRLQSLDFGLEFRRESVKHKTCDYRDYLHYKSIAKQNSYDDVLRIDNGRVKETSIANFLILRNNRWYTPEGPWLLDGILRQRLLNVGLLESAKIQVEKIKEAEAFATCNSVRGVWGVTVVDNLLRDEFHPSIRVLQSQVAELMEQHE